MWFTSTSEYVWTLTETGNFFKADELGCLYQQQRPCTVPAPGDRISLLPGVNNTGNEVILYARIPRGINDPFSYKYELFNPMWATWSIISHSEFYRYLNPKYILGTQRSEAEKILLGQT